MFSRRETLALVLSALGEERTQALDQIISHSDNLQATWYFFPLFPLIANEDR